MEWDKFSAEEITAKFDSMNGELQIMREGLAAIPEPVGGLIQDRLGRVLWMNRSAQLLFDTHLGKARGRTLGEITDSGNWPNAAQQNQHIVNASHPLPQMIFVMSLTRAGETQCYSMLKFPFRDSDLDWLVGVIAWRAKFKR